MSLRRVAELQVFQPTETPGARRAAAAGRKCIPGAVLGNGEDPARQWSGTQWVSRGALGHSSKPTGSCPARRRWGELGREQQKGKLGRARGRGPAGHLFLPRVRLARIGRSAARHRKWPVWVARDTRQQLRFCARRDAVPRAQRSERGRHPPAVRPLWFRHARGRRAWGSRPRAGVLTVGPPLTRVCSVTLDFVAPGAPTHLHTERVEPEHCQGQILILLPGLVSQGNWRSRLLGPMPIFLFSFFLSLVFHSLSILLERIAGKN